MALLGSVEAAKALIRSAGTTTFSEDEDARLLALHKLVTAAIERETGRTWGEEPTAETRVITETRQLEDVNECFDEVLAGKVPARLVFDMT